MNLTELPQINNEKCQIECIISALKMWQLSVKKRYAAAGKMH